MQMKTSIHIKFALLTLLLVAAAQAIPPWLNPPPLPKQPWKSGATTVTASGGTFRVSGNGPMGSYNRDGRVFPQWAGDMWMWSGFGYTIIDAVIEEGVTSIGNDVLVGMRKLRSVTIPSSVTHIGENVFYVSSDLTSITVAEDNAHYSSEDGVLFNKDKTRLILYPQGKQGVYTIPSSVTSIGNGAFMYCEGLTSVTIPNSVTSIGNKAFLNSGLTSVTIPNSVVSIGDEAFWGNPNLVSVTIPGGVMEIVQKKPDSETSIEKGYRKDMESIGKIITETRRDDQLNVTRGLGRSVFEKCYALTSVTIGDGAKAIGNGMFAYCSSLVFITIPNSVTHIGETAFFECTGLRSITFSSSVTYVGALAFYGRPDLIISVIFQGSQTIRCGEYVFGFNPSGYRYFPARVLLANPNVDKISVFLGFDKHIKVYDMKTGLWLVVSILIALILFTAILFIIIKSRKSSGRKRKKFRVITVTLSIFLLLTIYLSVVYATTFSIKIKTNLKDGGTVSPSGTTKYNVVTETIVTATANDGYVFTGWSGASTSTDAKIAVVVDGSRNRTLTANFKPISENEK
jgi:uncharacterized repeat protein (TIGR02543 family)